MHWRRKWQPTPVFLSGESQEWGNLVGCHLWGRTELDMKRLSSSSSSGLDGKESASSGGYVGSIPGVRKIPWRKEWLPTPVFLPGESPWTEEPHRLQSMGLQGAGHD